MVEDEVLESLSLYSLHNTEDISPPTELKWREKLARTMATNKVQYTVIILVILDSLIVIFALLIDMEIIVIPEDERHEEPDNTSLQLTNSSHVALSKYGTVLYSTATVIFSDIHNSTGNTSHGEGGDEHGEDLHDAPNKQLAEHVLHVASLTILSIFLIEVLFKVLAEGKHLLKHKAEMFDAVVVVVSFTLDVTFTIVPVSKLTQDYAGLLVLLRLWRITRIINGVILSVRLDADKKLNAQKALCTKSEKQVQRLTEKLRKLTRENEVLRTRLAVFEGSSDLGKGTATAPHPLLSFSSSSHTLPEIQQLLGSRGHVLDSQEQDVNLSLMQAVVSGVL